MAAGKMLHIAGRFPVTWWKSIGTGQLTDDLTAYCLFIGCPRSGHSLVGALLDGHPDIRMSHELDSLRYLYAGFVRRQLYYMILQKSAAYADPGIRRGGYVNALPAEWLGRHRRLLVIGDKHGEATTLRLRATPWLLERLRKTVRIPLRFVHVVRHPLDNISTIVKKTKVRGRPLSLPQAVDYYFSLCETVAHTQTRLGRDEILHVRHEALIADPHRSLTELCRFLGTDAPADYVQACAVALYEAPHRSRDGADWTPELIEAVRDRMREFPFLEAYLDEERVEAGSLD